MLNDYDTLNPLQGVEVPDYEVWNLQYATLTDKAADDFATTPGLAESWEMSNDGKTYTYTLRDGLEWSDGQPLTAEDVAYTVNRARAEEWLNYSSTVGNLRAKVIDERTVEITSGVPDPKLPAMDSYILPKHVWEKYDEKAITKYDGQDGVGSGPFTLTEAKRGQFWTMQANDSYWGGRPEVDEVVFRLFNNGDAMVAALKSGEIDAAHAVPAQSYKGLESTEGIVALQGEQGGFTEIAVNGGRPENQRVEGIGNGHPALSDIEFRKAIAHSIDKLTLIDKVAAGLARPGSTISPSPNPEWIPEIPEDEEFTFDLEKAKQILDAAGYKDSNGNGIRELDGKDINLTYYILSDSTTSAPNAEFVSGWLKEVGIGTTIKVVNGSKLTEIIGKGDYDMFQWGWTPFVDPDPELSYFTCDQLSKDPDDPTNYYNDANWCDAGLRRRLQGAEGRARQGEAGRDRAPDAEDVLRLGVVQRRLVRRRPQAYRTDRFEGWLRQPAEIGPVLFSNTSPTYANLTLVRVVGRERWWPAAGPGTSLSLSWAGLPSCWPCSCSGGDGAPTSASRP